jgi:hypothetical protein
VARLESVSQYVSFQGSKLTSSQNAVQKVGHDTDCDNDGCGLSHAVLEEVESVETIVGFLLLGKTRTAGWSRDGHGKHSDAEGEEVIGQEDANVGDTVDNDQELARHGDSLRVGCADELWR